MARVLEFKRSHDCAGELQCHVRQLTETLAVLKELGQGRTDNCWKCIAWELFQLLCTLAVVSVSFWKFWQWIIL